VKKKRKKLKDSKIIKKASENKIFVFILLVFFLFTFLSYISKGFVYNLANNDLDNVIHFIYSFGGWSTIMFLALIIFEVVLAPVPGLILNVAGGWVFGPLFGGILVLVGNIIGASICYFLARYVGGDYFERLSSNKSIQKYNRYIRKDGHYILFILRLNPLTSSDIFSYLAGFVNMRFKHFIISTTLGLAPLVFLLAYSGDYFIDNSLVFRLVFFIISVLYFAIFFYGLYKIGKNGLKNKIRKKRKKKR